jgi:hypothetical protein
VDRCLPAALRRARVRMSEGRCLGEAMDEQVGSENVLGGPPGHLEGLGAPRWKQRALYDALKDTAVITNGVRLARVATHDAAGGVRLGLILDGNAPLDTPAIRALVDARTT